MLFLAADHAENCWQKSAKMAKFFCQPKLTKMPDEYSLVYPKYAVAEFFSYRSILYFIAFLYDNFSNTVGYLCVSSWVQILGIIFAKKNAQILQKQAKIMQFYVL